MVLLLGFLSFSFCDLDKCSKTAAGGKVTIVQQETSKSVDINNFFLLN